MDQGTSLREMSTGIAALLLISATVALVGCGSSSGTAETVTVVVALLEDTATTGFVDLPGTAEERSHQVVAAPSHGTLQFEARTGHYEYVPADDYFGADVATLRVRYGDGSKVNVNFNIVVEAVNDAPRLSVAATASNSAETLETPIPIAATDVDGDALTVSAVANDSAVADVAVDTASRNLIVTPRARGTTIVTVSASDGRLTTSQRVEFSVGDATKRRNWEIAEPNVHAITIHNVSDRDIEFDWTHAGRRVLPDRSALLADIDAQRDAWRDAPYEYRMWRYVTDNVYHWYPVTEAFWIHDPLVLVNSIGFGFCDDVANAMAVIAREKGMPSRVWWLSGHVVPELYGEGVWRMFDSDLAVFYRKLNGDVASVEDLSLDPGLVTAPIDPVRPDAETANAYWEEVADIYSSTWNNRVEDVSFEGSSRLHGRVVLPPGARVVYPGRWAAPLAGSEAGVVFDAPAYGQLKLDLPPGFAGRIELPFVLWDTAGSGQINVSGRGYALGSEELRSSLQSWQELPENIEVESSDGAALIFLVSPVRYGMEPKTTIELTSIDAWGLELSLTRLDDTERSTGFDPSLRKP